MLQVLGSIRADKGQANDGLSSALLLVHLDSAKNLPVSSDMHTDMHTYTGVCVWRSVLAMVPLFYMVSPFGNSFPTRLVIPVFLIPYTQLQLLPLSFPPWLSHDVSCGEECVWRQSFQWLSEGASLCWVCVLWEHSYTIQDSVCESFASVRACFSLHFSVLFFVYACVLWLLPYKCFLMTSDFCRTLSGTLNSLCACFVVVFLLQTFCDNFLGTEMLACKIKCLYSWFTKCLLANLMKMCLIY